MENAGSSVLGVTHTRGSESLDLLTFSIVPMSGLCHVSIFIMKSSFMYSF